MAESQPEPTGSSIWESEIIVTDLIGRLIEFWGFKRNMGRVWAILYLSPQPLSARDVRDALQLSSGAVSMTLNELLRWGVVRKVWVRGERRDFFEAETQIWKMISRVFAEREGGEINAAIEQLERARATLDEHLESADASERQRAELHAARINALLHVARLGKQLLDSLLATNEVDVAPLTRIELEHDGDDADSAGG